MLVRSDQFTYQLRAHLNEGRASMVRVDLVERLRDASNLEKIPSEELEWLVSRGKIEAYETGDVIAPKGQGIDRLWVVLSGCVAVRVDRGVGSRRVIEWHSGDVSGMLPFSRMKGPPGDNYAEEATELLSINEKHFPEMIRECPEFTAFTVHMMLDRARSFNSSDLQDEKMVSLGRLAAGLAHELNNPASAAARGAKLLQTCVGQVESASRALRAANVSEELVDKIEQMRCDWLASPPSLLSSDRESEISDWLVRRQLDPTLASLLADTSVTTAGLDQLARVTPNEALDPVLRWIVAGCEARLLAVDVEDAATRIHQLVRAVEKFTYMDKPDAPEFVEVQPGLRDTIRVLDSKADSKGASVTLDAPPDLPLVHAAGGELNQVWMNLIDNALDAIPEGGHVGVAAQLMQDRVIVRVVDNGAGIPPDVMPQIFDPFFTTKPPGQGTGLGLEITRQLLRRHHGELSVESRPGRTEFCVRLLPKFP